MYWFVADVSTGRPDRVDRNAVTKIGDFGHLSFSSNPGRFMGVLNRIRESRDGRWSPPADRWAAAPLACRAPLAQAGKTATTAHQGLAPCAMLADVKSEPF